MSIDKGHVQAITRAMGRGCKLEPIDAWRDQDGKLWLIHGHHRRAALMKAGRKRHTARIHCGTLAEARLVSIASNSHDRLSLCTADRTQFAWRLHCDHGDAYSIARLAKATGISPKTVSNMRAVHLKLSEARQTLRRRRRCWRGGKAKGTCGLNQKCSESPEQELVCSRSCLMICKDARPRAKANCDGLRDSALSRKVRAFLQQGLRHSFIENSI